MQQPLFTRRQIIHLIVPLMIDQLSNTVVGFVDTVMVSSAGEAAVSAVSLVDSINRMFIFFFVSLATGGDDRRRPVSGRREPENAKKAGKQIFL